MHAPLRTGCHPQSYQFALTTAKSSRLPQKADIWFPKLITSAGFQISNHCLYAKGPLLASRSLARKRWKNLNPEVGTGGWGAQDLVDCLVLLFVVT